VLNSHIDGGKRVEIYLIIHGDTKVHAENETRPSKRSLEAKRPEIYLSIHGSDTNHGSDLG
jgi:hypothetical protein